MKYWYIVKPTPKEFLILQKIAFSRGIYWYPNLNYSPNKKECQTFRKKMSKKYIRFRRFTSQPRQLLIEEQTSYYEYDAVQTKLVDFKTFIKQLLITKPLRY